MKPTYPKPRAVRLGNLDHEVEKFLKKTNLKFSHFVKKAISAYLNDGGLKYEIDLADCALELRKMRSRLAGIGGDLRQIAFYFTAHNLLDEGELEVAHKELREEFSMIVDVFRRIEDKIYSKL